MFWKFSHHSVMRACHEPAEVREVEVASPIQNPISGGAKRVEKSNMLWYLTKIYDHLVLEFLIEDRKKNNIQEKTQRKQCQIDSFAHS